MTTTRPLVLVADDNPETLTLITKHLQLLDVQILEASDGEQALNMAQTQKPRVVVLDVMMPGMSGWEVCKAIRQDPGLSETRIIMCTGVGERLNDMASPMYGADDFVDKPVNFHALTDKVRQQL